MSQDRKTQLSLFGDEETLVKARRTKKEVFEGYDAFVAKFNAKAPKTTDDCFTPQPVYEAVLKWLGERVDLEGRPIVRPFYPGGDYKNEEYPENCVVVDNPPFSILASILRFYRATGIDYFLFAPALTLFSTPHDGDCAIVADCNIVYANGAKVNTGFHTSLFPGMRVLVSSTLRKAVMSVVRPAARGNITYEYPEGVETAARLHTALGGGGYMDC